MLVFVEKIASFMFDIGVALCRKLEKLVSFFFEGKRVRVFVLILLAVLFFCGMYVLNVYTPLVADDYNYSFRLDNPGKRVADLADIFNSQKFHYHHENGRVLTHSLTQFFLMLDKRVFNFCNSFVFTLLVMTLALHASGSARKLSPSAFLLIAASLFLFSPAFGSTFLWVDGSCNYLWGPTYVFLYLLPYRFQFERERAVINNPFLCFVYGLAGVPAAWSLENLAVTTVALALLALSLYYLKWRRVYAWNIYSLAGCLIGALFLLFAPANAVRMKVGNFSVHIVGNFVDITAFFFKSNTLLWPTAALLALLVCAGERERSRAGMVTFFYAAGLLISMYSMNLSPVFPAHARTTPVMFCVIAACALISAFDFSERKLRKVFAILLVCVIGTFGTSFRTAYKDIVSYDRSSRARIEYILSEKRASHLDVVVPHLHACTRWCVGYALNDINEGPKYWTSAPVARYYGLRSVRTERGLFMKN